MNYYFLVASLPMLAFGSPPPLAEPAFLERCREQLTPDDWAVLTAVWERDGEGATHPFVTAWRDRETQLRNAVARQRGARIGRDPQPYLRPAAGLDMRLAARVVDAFARPTPLDREMDIDRVRWDMLEELAGLNPFSLHAVLAYAARLRIAARWSRMETDAGRRRMDECVTQFAASVEVKPL